MDSNKKTRSLVVIIIFLLITNIAMLIFFVLQGKPASRSERNHENRGMYNSLKNDVGFSDEQLTRYKNMREQQIKKVHPLFNEVREAKRNFYGLIVSKNATDSLLNADADSIAQKQKNLDLQMFGYFKKVRSICTPAQTQKYDSLVQKVVDRMIGRSGNSHKK
ncbi:MAG TPA: hypothetical protein VFT78_00200 [Hanamia sp.]|nr:hypothetical protein [Hanamia sp.]